METPEVKEEEVDIKAALTGQKAEELPLPALFDKIAELKRGEKVKVKVENTAGRVIKSAELRNLVFESRAIILKMGQKARKFTTHTPIVIDGEIYTCVAADVKWKLVMFTYVGPKKVFTEKMAEAKIESAAIAKSIVKS